MSAKEKRCACPDCGVVVDVARAACGHDLCGFCRKDGHCHACQPLPAWTVEDARAWALSGRYFSPWELEWARKDLHGAARHISASCHGGCGPGSPWFDTRSMKLYIWPPGDSPLKTKDAPFVFALVDLLREAIAPKPQEVAAAVEAGTYAGPAVQGALL